MTGTLDPDFDIMEALNKVQERSAADLIRYVGMRMIELERHESFRVAWLIAVGGFAEESARL